MSMNLMSIYSLQMMASRRANVRESNRSSALIESFINMNFFEIMRGAFIFLHFFIHDGFPSPSYVNGKQPLKIINVQ